LERIVTKARIHQAGKVEAWNNSEEAGWNGWHKHIHDQSD